jgi:plastocyanin
MAEHKSLNTVIAWVLGSVALVFFLLLAGVASSALTKDPPEVSPYAPTSSQEGSDVFDTDAYQAGSDSGDDSGSSSDDGSGLEPTGTASITIEDFDFGDPISVAVGQTLTITNADGVPHTWTAADGAFDSGSISGSSSFEFAFDAVGEFEFFCTIHPSMKGSITVEG